MPKILGCTKEGFLDMMCCRDCECTPESVECIEKRQKLGNRYVEKRKIMIEDLMSDEESNYTTMRLLALASASMIINECEKWELDINDMDRPPNRTILGRLDSNFIWPRHTLILALESHVEIVYGFVKYSLDNFNGERYSEYYWIEEEGAAFLTKALDIYQNWKDNVIGNGNVIDGETWGRPAGSHTEVWNKNNKELLDLCKKRGY